MRRCSFQFLDHGLHHAHSRTDARVREENINNTLGARVGHIDKTRLRDDTLHKGQIETRPEHGMRGVETHVTGVVVGVHCVILNYVPALAPHAGARGDDADQLLFRVKAHEHREMFIERLFTLYEVHEKDAWYTRYSIPLISHRLHWLVRLCAVTKLIEEEREQRDGRNERKDGKRGIQPPVIEKLHGGHVGRRRGCWRWRRRIQTHARQHADVSGRRGLRARRPIVDADRRDATVPPANVPSSATGHGNMVGVHAVDRGRIEGGARASAIPLADGSCPVAGSGNPIHRVWHDGRLEVHRVDHRERDIPAGVGGKNLKTRNHL